MADHAKARKSWKRTCSALKSRAKNLSHKVKAVGPAVKDTVTSLSVGSRDLLTSATQSNKEKNHKGVRRIGTLSSHKNVAQMNALSLCVKNAPMIIFSTKKSAKCVRSEKIHLLAKANVINKKGLRPILMQETKVKPSLTMTRFKICENLKCSKTMREIRLEALAKFLISTPSLGNKIRRLSRDK